MFSSVVKIFVILGLLSRVYSTPTTITSPPLSENVISNDKDYLREAFGQCLHKKNVSKCLKHKFIDVVDDVIKSDDPLSINLFNIKMSLNKNPHFKLDKTADESRSFEDIISNKLRNLLESRVIQMKLTDDAKDNFESTDVNEARKKKGGGGGSKHGGMMMSGKNISS